MELDPRGKVQIVKNTNALPAKCVICAKPVDGSRLFIDFGFDIDFYGQVLFCVDCLAPVAQACGYVPYEQFRTLAETLAISLDREKELQAKYDHANDLLIGILGYQPTFAVSVDSDNDSLVHEESEPEGQSDSDFDGEQQGTDESDSESRQRDVFEATDSEPSESGISL
jgi:hypothetical protein